MGIWRKELFASVENVKFLKELDKLIDLRYAILIDVIKLKPRDAYRRLVESTILRKMLRWYHRNKVRKLIGELSAE